MIDFHIHILPGIDDGSQNWDETMKLARQSADFGITHLVATPHGSGENLAVLLPKRDQLIMELRQRLQEEKIPLTVLPGLEYSADGHSSDSALATPECRCGNPDVKNRPMLVELPFTVNLDFAANLLFNAQIKNVTLILAHPERYDGFLKKIDFLKDLMDKGLYLQFNSNNFKGGFLHNSIPKAILKLIEYAKEQVIIGSDAHHPEYRPAGLLDARKRITDAFGEDAWTLISHDTPAQLLGIK